MRHEDVAAQPGSRADALGRWVEGAGDGPYLGSWVTDAEPRLVPGLSELLGEAFEQLVDNFANPQPQPVLKCFVNLQLETNPQA